MKDYTNLKHLLQETETFPLRFTFKFIGRNTPAFSAGVAALERTFPVLTHEMTRQSAGGNHISKTYAFDAPNADIIIAVFVEIERIEDLLVML